MVAIHRTAVREGDELALRRVLKRAARIAPTWDAQAELAALTVERRPAPAQPAPGVAGLAGWDRTCAAAGEAMTKPASLPWATLTRTCLQ